MGLAAGAPSKWLALLLVHQVSGSLMCGYVDGANKAEEDVFLL